MTHLLAALSFSKLQEFLEPSLFFIVESIWVSVIVDTVVKVLILSLTDSLPRDCVHHFGDENLLNFCTQARVWISFRKMSFFLIFFDVFESEIAKCAQPAECAKMIEFTVLFRMPYF